MIRIVYLTAILSTVSGKAAEVAPELLERVWDAKWIRAAESSNSEYGVYYFRNEISLKDEPESFVVNVSADCRYKLYVNGELVSWGPATGDLFNWNFETVDIAPHLSEGNNAIAAIVWNGGAERPESQISFRTGFILQGNGSAESVLNTGTNWKAIKSTAYKPIPGIGYPTYYVAGPGEELNMRALPIGWKQVSFDDNDWGDAVEVEVGWPQGGKPKGTGLASEWMLVPRSIPQMEISARQFESVRRSEGVEIGTKFLEGESTIRVAENSTATVLLDNGVLTNAFPKVRFSGGKNAEIELVYTEALYEYAEGQWTPRKGHRDEVEGKSILGRTDRIICGSGENQEYVPLSWRTFRYVQVRIKTKNEPLLLKSISSEFVGYPFEKASSWTNSNGSLEQILDVGWRTARLCAVETYMDCPYYEQLQYIGDTRIQALVTVYNTSDNRLIRNALNQMDQSRIAEGITLSRHPSKTPQVISTFSLWYIGMLHDYWTYVDEPEYIAKKLSGTRSILAFYEDYRSEDGLLKRPPYWLFTDWVPDGEGWSRGEGPFGDDEESSILDLTLLWNYRLAAEMEEAMGLSDKAIKYKQKIESMEIAIRKAYWDEKRGLFADTKKKRTFSQHANALAILGGLVEGEEATRLATKLEAGNGMAKATIYFKYYVHLALWRAGLGDRYLDWLGKWHENIDQGLTTWAEKAEVDTSRSDCHAWGSSPNIEFYRIVLGIDSDSPGWSKVKIKPHLGNLQHAAGSTPHPKGEISAAYTKTNDKWEIVITIPEDVEGVLIWNEKEYPLAPGENHFVFLD